MIHYGDSHPSLGLIVTFPLMILLFVGLIVFGFCLRNREWDTFDDDLRRWLPRITWALAAVVFIGTVLGMYPYKAEYHKWQNISGTITSTNSRFLAKQSGTDQKFVITFQGSDQQFGCNDTRCSTLREGDWAEITCKRVFQLFGTPGYDCNFVSYRKKQS